jgi:PDZ domain
VAVFQHILLPMRALKPILCLALLLTVQHIFAQKNVKIGGIGGLSIFDSVAQRPIIKALEYYHYIEANTLRPGDLILEIDKIPIHKMTYGEVLGLVQGNIGTPMSLKVLRYNGIEKYYEINRIRVTLDMNPVWWQIPEYKYLSLNDGINFFIKELKNNCKNSIDTSVQPIIPNQKFYSKYLIRGAYESVYVASKGGRYMWDCSFVQTDDRAKAEGMYNYIKIQLSKVNIKNVILTKKESITPEHRTLSFVTNESSDVWLTNLQMQVKMHKIMDAVEQKELWRVELQVQI